MQISPTLQRSKRCRSAPKLQAQVQAAVASLQQQNQNQPQQPPNNVNLTVNNVAPVPPPNVPQQPTVATTKAPNNQNANPPQQKTTANQNVNGGYGPGLPVPQNAQGPVNGINNNGIPTSAPGQIQTAMPATCRLMGCGNPVYTDAMSNYASEYCSKRHRE